MGFLGLNPYYRPAANPSSSVMAKGRKKSVAHELV